MQPVSPDRYAIASHTIARIGEMLGRPRRLNLLAFILPAGQQHQPFSGR